MEEIRKSAKTVDDAIAAALAELGAAREEVDITVIDEGSKGFLGMFGSKDAVVLVKKNFNPEKEAETFLKEVFLSMGLIVKIKTEQKDKHLYIDLTGDDMGILIGKRGQTLDALQYLVNLVVNKKSPYYISVMLDTENYRQRRKETLESLAFNLAKKVKHTKRNVVLEPMNPYERRIIHSALQNDRFVTTYSEGEDPYRYVVITLKLDTRYPLLYTAVFCFKKRAITENLFVFKKGSQTLQKSACKAKKTLRALPSNTCKPLKRFDPNFICLRRKKI